MQVDLERWIPDIRRLSCDVRRISNSNDIRRSFMCVYILISAELSVTRHPKIMKHVFLYKSQVYSQQRKIATVKTMIL